MPRHVLIVDADAGAAQATRARIERLLPGTTIAVEASPEAGWLSVQRHPPDVLVIDPSPRCLDAMLLIQLLKEAQPTSRVIVLASQPTPSLRCALQRIGVDAHLDKGAALPVLLDHLHAALHGALSSDLQPRAS